MADSTIITGQYVRIDQAAASLGERLLARIIDYVLLALYIISSLYVIGKLPGGMKNGDMFIFTLFFLYVPVLGYSLFFELFNQGQTPGKRLMNIRVVMKDGSTPSLGAYLLRWLLFLVDVPLTGGLGVIFILVNKDNQRIGDLAAGTLVIRTRQYRKVKVSLDEYSHLLEGYSPVFPQAARLSLEQVRVIERALASSGKTRKIYLAQLGMKLKKVLSLDAAPMEDEELLRQLVKDYQYYAFVEV